jgi:hypothetical protein
MSLSQPPFLTALTVEEVRETMAQRCVRLTASVEAEVMNVIRSDGYASLAAFLRAAVENELKRRNITSQAERDIAATLEQYRREIRRELTSVATAINAQFAFLDAFVRVMLHCIPEPAAEIYESARAQARQRHDKLLRIAAVILKGEANATMAELAGNGDG